MAHFIPIGISSAMSLLWKLGRSRGSCRGARISPATLYAASHRALDSSSGRESGIEGGEAWQMGSYISISGSLLGFLDGGSCASFSLPPYGKFCIYCVGWAMTENTKSEELP